MVKTKQLNVYNGKVSKGVNNEYPTPPDSFRQPCLALLVGQRLSGKSYLTSKILSQAKDDNTFDVVYCITPSFCSNKAYFGKYIKEENVFYPTKDSIQKVIKLVEADRDEWETFQEQKEEYKKFQKKLRENPILSDYDLIKYYDKGFLAGFRACETGGLKGCPLDNEPKWKYKSERPPQSCLVLDDVLGSQAILQSSGLTKIATLNRHIAPLKENFGERSALGLAVIICCQTYRMNSGIGRALRENVSMLTLFKNKQQKQLDAIKEELANVVDLDQFDIAYNYATNEPHGSLTIDFNPKNEIKFRKNLNEAIIF